MTSGDAVTLRQGDFLAMDCGRVDGVLMNPPFKNGADVKHIRHALGMVRPGGRLVSICANGPRQRAQLMPQASRWLELPAGSFASEGTNVSAAICIFDV